MVAFFNFMCNYLVTLLRGDSMYYTNRIENLRIDSDKTQQQIADILHCQREVYRRYEKGERELPLWAAIKLAKYYDVSLDYLTGQTAKRSPFPKE